MSIGEQIRKYRETQNFTQEQLAEKVDVHPNTIRRWELSERTPNSAKLADLCQALGVSVVELMAEDNTPMLPIKKVPASSTRNSKWILVYERDGERIELPPTEQGYNIINRIAEAMVKRPAMVTQTAVMA